MLRITGAVGMLPAIVQLIECLMHKEGFPGVFWIHFWTQPFMISDAFSYIKDVQLIHCCSAPTVSSTFSPTLLQDQSAWQNISTCHEQTENIQVLLTPSNSCFKHMRWIVTALLPASPLECKCSDLWSKGGNCSLLTDTARLWKLQLSTLIFLWTWATE